MSFIKSYWKKSVEGKFSKLNLYFKLVDNLSSLYIFLAKDLKLQNKCCTVMSLFL